MIPFELKLGSQWVCWNSFKSVWYLGRRSHAERFNYDIHSDETMVNHPKPLAKRVEEVYTLFPTATRVWVTNQRFNAL